ncbi:MAG TPA: hypothetical protein VFE10_03320 [Phenylobacterium sp.]|jgi:hypothetical protein|nr:hypothetical protein [Phenylobacterium sp.]
MTRFALAACLVAGAALTCLPTPLAAQPAEEAQAMAGFFAGTLEIDVPAANWSAKRYFAPDHTYRETGADGELRGAWAIEKGKICTSPGKPLGEDRMPKYCNLGLGKHIGDSWKDSDPVTDNAVMFKLSPGRS